MKKYINVMVIMLVLFVIVGCNSNNTITDNEKFKTEYESINGLDCNYNDYKYLSVNIPKNNNIIYKTDQEIIDVIKNETSVIYFGFNTCPWCRSMVENLIKVTTDLNIEHVYYVDIKNIRDTLEMNDEGKIMRTNSGSTYYLELLDLLRDYLSDYEIKDNEGNSIKTGSKRIYAPNVIVSNKGNIVGLTTGVSDNLTNPYGTISDELKTESYNELYNLISKIKPSNVCIENGNC